MDQDALAEAYDRYAPPIYRFLCGFLGNKEDAADAVHNTFVNLARRERVGIADLGAYLWTAARNEARTIARKAVQPHLEPRNGQPSDPTERARVESALAALPEEQREVIILHVLEGLSFRETAEHLRISPDTVASRFRYAREKLGSIL